MKVEDLYLGKVHDDQYSGYSENNYYIMALKVTFKLNLQVQVPLNLYIHVIDTLCLTNILLIFSAPTMNKF